MCDEKNNSSCIVNVYGGQLVTEIKIGAFTFCEELTEVTLPDTLERIFFTGYNTFCDFLFIVEKIKSDAEIFNIEFNFGQR